MICDKTSSKFSQNHVTSIVLEAWLLHTFWHASSTAYQLGLMTRTILQPVFSCELQLCVAAQSTSLHKITAKNEGNLLSALFPFLSS
jgi:hypothetical protein